MGMVREVVIMGKADVQDGKDMIVIDQWDGKDLGKK